MSAQKRECVGQPKTRYASKRMTADNEPKVIEGRTLNSHHDHSANKEKVASFSPTLTVVSQNDGHEPAPTAM